MDNTWLERALRAGRIGAGLALGAAALAGCSGASGADGHQDRARLVELAHACDGELSTYASVDVSGTRRSEALRTDRLAAIRVEAERVALCGGTLRVVAFSASTTSSSELFDGAIEAPGATEGARLRKVDKTVDPVMEEVESSWDEALDSLSADGSDVVGQFGAAGEYFAQHPEADHRALVLTDGLQTEGPFVPSSTTTAEAAADIAGSIPAPDLGADAVVVLAGIGRASDEPRSTAFVDVLDRFYMTYCNRTHANCQVVTDLSSN
jgi:hypothetical protein